MRSNTLNCKEIMSPPVIDLNSINPLGSSKEIAYSNPKPVLYKIADLGMGC